MDAVLLAGSFLMWAAGTLIIFDALQTLIQRRRFVVKGDPRLRLIK